MYLYSMADVSMPLAKVIPVVNGLVHIVLGDDPNPLVQVWTLLSVTFF